MHFLLDNKDWFLSGLGIALIGAVFGSVRIGGARLLRWWQRRRDLKSLIATVGAELYPRNVLEQATSNFISPEFVNVDPAESDEPALMVAAREDITKKLDYVLSHRTEHKYFFIFGGSGTGKSTLLINYYARAVRRNRNGIKMLLLPAGHAQTDERIRQCSDKRNTVLLLDAFDEDESAIVDYAERMRDIASLTDEFCKVVITCRTQFFPKDRFIPDHLGKVRGPRAAGRRATHYFYRLYLAPFSERQVRRYLHRKFPLMFQWKNRFRAHRIVEKAPNLVARPMLLAQIDDLITEGKDIAYSFELYHVMADAWLKREEGVHEEIHAKPIMDFCKMLAVESFGQMRHRSRAIDYQRFTPEQLKALGGEWGLDVSQWQLTGRSLLNRDGNGYYKFAHRSIMEFFVVEAFIAGQYELAHQPWTDQMIAFLRERVVHALVEAKKNQCGLPGWIPHIVGAGAQRHVSQSYREHKGELIHAIYLSALYTGISAWTPDSNGMVHDRLTDRTWWIGSTEPKDRNSINDCIKSATNSSGLNWRLPSWDEAFSFYFGVFYCCEGNSSLPLEWLEFPTQDDFLIWTNSRLPHGKQGAGMPLLFAPPKDWDMKARFILVSYPNAETATSMTR